MINQQALKDRLKLIAEENDIPFNSCWKQLLLERFLTRVGRSAHAHKLIFKGGFLLAYMMKIGRETVDLDFLLIRMRAEKKMIESICKEIAYISLNDGFSFSFADIKLLSQPHMDYPGYRITLNAVFENMKDKIHIDIGVGDVVEPKPLEIKLFHYRGKPFFEDTLSLLVYPIETIFSEKLETVLSKGSRNSRIKDFHDLFLLVREKELINLTKLKEAISNTFINRGTPLAIIQFDVLGIKTLQELWTAHVSGLGATAKKLELPQDFAAVIKAINTTIESMLP
ncbi:MAG: hypothetical protein K1060chlam2_01385 [Chlamydiae bacterium]|nr:hypothetical protein [Chlamydiota bacterium]